MLTPHRRRELQIENTQIPRRSIFSYLSVWKWFSLVQREQLACRQLISKKAGREHSRQVLSKPSRREVCILLPEQTDLLGLLSFRVKNFMAT